MNPTIAAPSALPVSASWTRTNVEHRAMWIVAATACVLMLAVNLFRREGYTGDEGFYGVTALNMLESPEYILRPSYFPAGDFAAERDGFAHPPFNSYFYAASLWVARGSTAGPEVLNVLTFAALLFLVYRITAQFDRRAAQFSVLLLAASAPMVGYFSMLEAEPLMTVFGLAALDCALRARRGNGTGRWTVTRSPGHGFPQHRGRLGVVARPAGEDTRLHLQSRWLFPSGLALGMAFVLKLWLFGPVALAVAAALAWNVVTEFATPRARIVCAVHAVGIMAVGFVIPAAVHLFAVAVFYPQDLSFWLRNIYFGIFTQAGISGSKLAGNATPAEWVHPVWYYAAAIYRDHFFLVPPIAFGAASLASDKRFRSGFLVVTLAGLAGLAPLSLMKVKEPLYVLSCVVFLYLLAGACVASVRRRYVTHRKLDRFSLWFGSAVTVSLLLVFPLAQARGIQPDKLTANFVLAHTVVFAVFLAVVLWTNRRRAAAVFGWILCAACAIAVIAVAAWNSLSRAPRDATIARLAGPYLQPNPAGTLSLIASNFKSYQYYAFHRGMYWHELPAESPDRVFAEPEFSHVRVFVMSPEDLSRLRNEVWLTWLERHATDKTGELDLQLGRISGYRLFVRPEETPAR